jgi:hypothetical protein
MAEHEQRPAAIQLTAAALHCAVQSGDIEAALWLGEAVLTQADALLAALRAELAGSPPPYLIAVPADLAVALREAREVRKADAWRTRAEWERENLYETSRGLEDGVFFTLKDI